MTPRPSPGYEEGISLVEMLVAILVLGIIMAAMAQSLVGSLRSAQAQERQVHATSLTRQLIEEARGVPWPQLGICEDDVAATFPAGTFEYPDGSVEVVVPISMTDDACDPLSSAAIRAVETIERNGVAYTVRTVITWHDDPLDDDASGNDSDPDDLKRVLVQADWEHRGTPRMSTIESFVSEDNFSPPLVAEVLHADGKPYTYLESYAGGTDDGLTQTPVVLRVTAAVPQSGIEARWQNADGGTIVRGMESSDKIVWTHTIPKGDPDFEANRLSNGEIVFEFTAREAATARATTTFGRGLFLIEPSAVGVSQERLTGASGAAIEVIQVVADSRQICDVPLRLSVFAEGLLRSDFVTVVWTDGLGQQEMQAAPEGAGPSGSTFSSEVPATTFPGGGDLPATVTVSFILQRVGDGLTIPDPIPETAPWEPNADFTVQEVTTCAG